jgi:O-antigen ligase
LWNAALSSSTGRAALPLSARAERVLVFLVLAVTLTLSPALGHPAAQLLPGLAVLSIPLLIARADARWAPPPLAAVFLLAFAGLLLLIAVSANDLEDTLAAAEFLAFPLSWPLAMLVGRAAAPGNAARVGSLTLAGTGIAFAYAAATVFLSPVLRAGDVIGNDPIRLADTAVILAFLSAVLMAPSAQGATRWFYLLAGPLLALGVVVLTGTRIAMVAYPVLACVSIVLTMERKGRGLLLGLAVALLLVALVMTSGLGNQRFMSLAQTLADVVGGRASTADEAVSLRMMFWQAGWSVFLSSPLFGVGWGNMMEMVLALMPAGSVPRDYFSHLHNEALTVAVAGGLAGLALFVGLLLAPLVIALRSVRDSQYTARLGGVIVVIIAYLLMGLTDTMLFFRLHTALYVGFMAILLGHCRDSSADRV